MYKIIDETATLQTEAFYDMKDKSDDNGVEQFKLININKHINPTQYWSFCI